MTTLAVLLPWRAGSAPPPEATPIGRAGLHLAQEGFTLLFGESLRDGAFDAVIARPGRWEPATPEVVAAVSAVYDRFPCQSRPEAHRALRTALAAARWGNPQGIVHLCRDKLATQRHLVARGVALPEVEADPARFAERLSAFEAGFLKPRHGALGRGVRYVLPGDPLPARVPGAVRAGSGFAEDDALLQRAVPPPPGFAGVCVRALVQRDPGGSWVVPTPAARCDRVDRVVNVARGATVLPVADAFGPRVDDAVRALAANVAEALAAGDPDVVELGVDLALDPGLHPHVIEVNGKPRGRLSALAEQDPARFQAEHDAAILRPLRALAAGT